MQAACSLSQARIKTPEDDAGPFALHNFLPAGILALPIHTEALRCDPCHSNGWHEWPGYLQLSGIVHAEEHDFLRMLDFLTSQEFVSATCRLGSFPKLLVRIHLIPFDLAGVEGRLRWRDVQTVLQPARKYLRALLLRVTKDPEAWAGSLSGLVGRNVPFFPQDTVRSPEYMRVFLNLKFSP